MTKPVPATEIESIVGRQRHESDHYARADSENQTVFILHSRECLQAFDDLRECPFSIALDRGIYHYVPWWGWRRVQDRPVRVQIFREWLVPDLMAVREAEGIEP